MPLHYWKYNLRREPEMKRESFFFMFFLLLAGAGFSQKMTVKDSDSNILMEVNDEGTVGSITVPSGTAPSTTTNKLYNVGGALYWNGNTLAAGGTSWSLAGNSGTTPGTNFIGTTDNQALEFKVNGNRVLRIEPMYLSPNLLGGYNSNWISVDVVGATVCGGGAASSANRVTDHFGSVVGGTSNQAGDNDGSPESAQCDVVCGGSLNIAAGNYTMVGGGRDNTASGYASTIGGGYSNRAKGAYAAVPGGKENSANGVNCFAAGYKAKTNHEGSFVWADLSTSDSIATSAAHQFIVRAKGHIFLTTGPLPTDQGFINTNAGGTSGAYLSMGGTWTNSSDRNNKLGFESVNSEEILQKVADLPITRWQYRDEDGSVRHIGPMAQDFYSAFGVGQDDRHLATVDVDGVTLAAIQGLYTIVREKDAEIKELREKNAEINERLEALERK
jgi:hypothetical protein